MLLESFAVACLVGRVLAAVASQRELWSVCDQCRCYVLELVLLFGVRNGRGEVSCTPSMEIKTS